MTADHLDAIDTALSEARSYQSRYESAAGENTDPDDAEGNRDIASHYRSIAERTAEVESLVRSLVSGSLSTYDTREKVVVDRDELRRLREGANRGDLIWVDVVDACDRWLSSAPLTPKEGRE